MIEKTLLHLSLIKGIGPAAIQKLLASCSSLELTELYFMSEQEIEARFGFSNSLAQTLVAGLRNKALLERELELMTQHAIEWTTVISDTYPVLLKTIAHAPIILTWQGNIAAQTSKTVACVGARACNSYGLHVIEKLIPDLVAEQWSIISGGALGIDTLAHKKTIQSGGTTYAVLGSGLLQPYPATNKKLFEEIVASGGAVISSFALEQAPLAGNFPARNRIISGLSKATLVIQAAEKSGALITARYALEQGREVCAVPGAITDPLSYGTHQLISSGALLVTKAADITHALGYQSLTQKKSVQPDRAKQSSFIQKAPAFEQLSLPEKLLALCTQPKSFDELLTQLECTESDMQTTLFELQLEGKLEQDFMGRWQALSSCKLF